ncbi:protein of unknown function (plasmid) [Cupriavidus taiwanensis]|nr:protein of unknown function [Cupriavidus taiwanensis]SOZ74662.1 protein of unknown function [Cupriavidus taiwanensis]
MDQQNKFSHVKPTDTAFTSDGLRDFFVYRDLGIPAAKSLPIWYAPIAPLKPALADMSMVPISISSTC